MAETATEGQRSRRPEPVIRISAATGVLPVLPGDAGGSTILFVTAVVVLTA